MSEIQDLIQVAADAVHGSADTAADFIRGSDYESLIGPTAIIYTRQARRDVDMFNATKFHTAQGDDLTNLVKKRFNVDRYLDTRGQGSATIARPDATGLGGTIWAGTRITIFGGELKYYRVTKDWPIATADLTATIPIESVEIGPDSRADQVTALRFEDQLWDNTWTVTGLKCAPGTVYESARDLIARVRTGRRDARVGHRKKIETICKAAGADKVLIFNADFGGDAVDHGLNVCYVGDLGYTASPDLVKACFLALRKARVLGDHLQVFPMARQNMPVVVDVYLRDAPATFDLTRLDRIHGASIRQYLGGSEGGFTFSRTGIQSAVSLRTPEVQDVTVVLPSSDVGILSAGNFPLTLTRYVASTIAIRYHGP